MLGAAFTKRAATNVPTADAAGENHLHRLRAVFRPLRESAWAFCFASVVSFALTSSPGSLPGRFFSSKVMTFLGKYSYGLYVFHAMLTFYLGDHHTLEWFEGWVPQHFLAILVQAEKPGLGKAG